MLSRLVELICPQKKFAFLHIFLDPFLRWTSTEHRCCIYLMPRWKLSIIALVDLRGTSACSSLEPRPGRSSRWGRVTASRGGLLAAWKAVWGVWREEGGGTGLSGSRKKHMSCLFGASFVTGPPPPPFPALLLALFSPPPCHSEVRVSATHTRGGACKHRQTHTDCNSMVECIIDGSALKDLLLIL